FDHTARALAEINWTDYKITLSDFYRYFSDRAGSEDVNRVKRQNNFLEATIGAEFDQLGFEAGYTFGVENFISDNTLFSSALGDITYHDKDRFLNTFAGQLSYRFLPKLSFLLDSILGILTYDSPKSSDSWYTEILMGLLGELHEDFSTNLKGGFRYQSYDTSELTDSNDFIGVVASGGISYRHTRDDIINFNVEKGYIRIYVSEPELL
ncbi:MAG: outer membrane beta-barrel protein, partial [Candidatus Omnitrophica bacterium]|nr:outer membrane beta-barrel protein [Candidatus Omnitrophota bacterium]